MGYPEKDTVLDFVIHNAQVYLVWGVTTIVCHCMFIPPEIYIGEQDLEWLCILLA